MRDEIENQPETLASYAERLASAPGVADVSELVFAGSGDSYSAAIWAEQLSSGKAVAFDPSELALEPSRAKSKTVVILSVSGRTRSSLLLAENVLGVARKRIALTSSADSPLAKNCDETWLLEYRRAGTPTAGTASYTSSLLACAHLIGQLPSVDSMWTLMSALDTAKRNMLSVRKGGAVVFVGSGLDYPLAIYGGLKMNEVLGLKSICCTPEQLVHAIIFSLDKETDTIVMINPSSTERFDEVKQATIASGFSVHSVGATTAQHPVVRSFEVAFCLQYLAYNLAIKTGLTEVAYLSNRDALDLSSRLIY